MNLRRAAVFVLMFSLACPLLVGCRGRSTLRERDRPEQGAVGDLGEGFFDERVEAFVVPPEGWKLDPPKTSDKHNALVWLSPTGATAYGVIYFRLPGVTALIGDGKYKHERALGGFMEEFTKDQGEAELLESRYVNDRRAIRFVAAGGLYKIRPILTIRGTSGWAVYAGTYNEQEEQPDELEIAVRAREATQVGTAAAGGAESASERLRELFSDGDEAE